MQTTLQFTPEIDSEPSPITPIQWIDKMYIKRDDLCIINGASGGKARTCWALTRKAVGGVVTAGSRQSPQVELVATMAKAAGLRCIAHVPNGDISSGPVAHAAELGAEIYQHRPGYNSVIVSRAKKCAAEMGFTEIPFGMECEEAVTQTRRQVANIPFSVKRIVVPVGSGMSLAGILWGLLDFRGRRTPFTNSSLTVLGVVVGADPTKRLDKYAPGDWRNTVTLVSSGVPYARHVDASIGDIVLDPVYEAKCVGHLQAGDAFWIVGCRDIK